MPSWNLWLYSKYLTTRKPEASTIVAIRLPTSTLRLSIWAPRMAHAIVSDESRSTSVLVAPRTVSSWSEAAS